MSSPAFSLEGLTINIEQEIRLVSPAEWLAARKKLLAKEKEYVRLRDTLAAERRKLPWVKVEKNYVFDTPSGKKTLADLFDGRSQLIIYHFMFGHVFHTYSSYARGTENLMNTYNFLDLVPKGRDEDGLPFTMAWVRHHDRYEDGRLADAARPYWPANSAAEPLSPKRAAAAAKGEGSCCQGEKR